MSKLQEAKNHALWQVAESVRDEATIAMEWANVYHRLCEAELVQDQVIFNEALDDIDEMDDEPDQVPHRFTRFQDA